MDLRRAAVVWDLHAAPWAPIMLGFVDGLRAHGVEVVVAPAAADFASAEHVARFDPDAVIVGVHHDVRPHLEAWRSTVGASRAWVALAFDDPYDMATTLALAPQFDLVLTPEACAVSTYERHGWRADVLLPTVCDRWHVPASFPVAARHDVLHVGGNQWKPRRTWLPVLSEELRKKGLTLTQATGGRRGWLCGRALTEELHRSRLTIDIPRDEWFRTNPMGIPCTYVGPRAHIAAACGVPCLMLNPRGDLDSTYPDAPRSVLDDGVGAVLDLLDDDEGRQQIAAANLDRFRRLHSPRVRAERLKHLIEAWCLAGRAR
jgi:hypothetical protein